MTQQSSLDPRGKMLKIFSIASAVVFGVLALVQEWRHDQATQAKKREIVRLKAEMRELNLLEVELRRKVELAGTIELVARRDREITSRFVVSESKQQSELSEDFNRFLPPIQNLNKQPVAEHQASLEVLQNHEAQLQQVRQRQDAIEQRLNNLVKGGWQRPRF